MHTEQGRSGLWPLLLDSLDANDGGFRPWGSEEVFPEQMSSPASHDASSLLARCWPAYTAADEDDDDVLDTDRRFAVTASFGQSWPGLAPNRATTTNPDQLAGESAQEFLADHPKVRLGLVAAASGAGALAVVGWADPSNYDNDTAKFSTVVCDWEHRFGARVVAVGFSTLHLSVDAPPAGAREALLVTAEHFAFCPDNIGRAAGRTHWPHTLSGLLAPAAATFGGSEPVRRRPTGNWPTGVRCEGFRRRTAPNRPPTAFPTIAWA
ncbi:DUF4253 domain-containing protein [Streptomyces sp. NPDC102359]|uniref:DUF4253 domain-containing protein n=1 Tax=unclassified Streptomyces TaxID=2593676 RepID=UPI0038147BE2